MYKKSSDTFLYQDKYTGRSLNFEGLCHALFDFFHNGDSLLFSLIQPLILKLKQLAGLLSQLQDLRLYASSLLVLYDGALEDPKVDIRMIDFANCIVSVKEIMNEQHRFPPEDQVGPDTGYLLGIHTLIKAFELIYKKGNCIESVYSE